MLYFINNKLSLKTIRTFINKSSQMYYNIIKQREKDCKTGSDKK